MPPDVPNGNPALLAAMMDQLDQLLPALLGQGGKLGRITVPSLPGVIPRSLAMMAFSIAPIAFRSVARSQGPRLGHENDASCWIGTGVP